MVWKPSAGNGFSSVCYFLKSYHRCCVICVFLDHYAYCSDWAMLSEISLMLCHFKSDRDEIWQYCSLSKYTSIDEVKFFYVAILSWWQLWRMPVSCSLAATCSSILRLPANPLSVCDIIDSLCVLQFLIHRTFILVCFHAYKLHSLDQVSNDTSVSPHVAYGL